MFRIITSAPGRFVDWTMDTSTRNVVIVFAAIVAVVVGGIVAAVLVFGIKGGNCSTYTTVTPVVTSTGVSVATGVGVACQ